MKHPITFAVVFAAYAAISIAQTPAPNDWPSYGRTPGGTRFSPLTRITRDNVSKLVAAWRYHTGEPALDLPRQPSLQVTPIVVDDVMYISTPLGKVMALDPATGSEIWRYDARVDPKAGYGDFASRGVSTWLDTTLKPGAPCRRRIYVATIDARLIALDAMSGYPCVVFGVEGTIGLREALRVRPAFPTAYEVTSPPLVVNDLVITGSAVADNSRPDAGQRRGARLRRANRASCDGRGIRFRRIRKIRRTATWRGRQRRPHRRGERLVGDRRRSGARSRVSADLAAPRRTTTARCASATTATRTRSSRCARRRAQSSGTSRPCTTISGTTTTPLRPRW